MESPETIRSRYESYSEAREREAYLRHSGQEAELGPSELDGLYDDVTCGDYVDAVVLERDRARSTDARSDLDRLRFGLESAFLERSVRDLDADLARRADAENASPEELLRIREERFCRLGEARSALGYSCGLERARARLPEILHDDWANAALRYLSSTEVVYRELMRRVLPALGIDPGQPRLSDVAIVDCLGRQFDSIFPADRLSRALRYAIEPLGMALDKLHGLQIDLEPRPARRPASQTFAIRVPDDVRVSTGFGAGPGGYARHFFCTGQALSFAFTSPSLPIERRRPYDRALQRAWGRMLSDRLADPAWLAELPLGPKADALIWSMRLRTLFVRRRWAARVAVDRALAALAGAGDPRRTSDVYAQAFESATGFETRPEDYLLHASAELESIDELRGQCLAAQLFEHLRARYGRRYWRERAVGELLKEIWNTGSTYTAEMLAAELSLGRLDVDVLIDEAHRGG